MDTQAAAITLGSVLVVEDDLPSQSRALRLLREVAGDAVQVEVAGDLASARATAGTHFDIALVDVVLPDGSGVDFIGWLGEAYPQLPAVIVSSWADENTILAAVRNGAIGYLLKTAEDIELKMALHSLQRGGATIDPMIARRLLELMSSMPEPAADVLVQDAPVMLSERETQIL